jgi:hypothetical protein
MSLMIDDPDDLLRLLRKLNLKVSSVDELRQLLASINAHYNPEATRQKTGKLIGTAVPGSMAAAAAGASFFLLVLGSGSSNPVLTISGLALIWGACAIVSVAAVIAGSILTGVRRRLVPNDRPTAERPTTTDERVVAAITHDLSF